MNFSDKFVDFMTETIYGINANKYDKQNIKRKFGPIIEGKNSLFIKDPIQAQDFLEGYYHMWQDLEQISEEKSIIKTKLKKQKEQPIPDIWMEKYNDLEKNNQFLKDMLADKRKEEIEDYNTHPYCQELLKRVERAERDANIQKEKFEILQAQTTKSKENYDNKLEEYSSELCKLEENFEKKKKSFVAKAKADNKEEERLEMKMLKADIKKLKKTIEKRDKKIKRLVQEMSESSDSDSD